MEANIVTSDNRLFTADRTTDVAVVFCVPVRTIGSVVGSGNR